MKQKKSTPDLFLYKFSITMLSALATYLFVMLFVFVIYA